MAGPSYVRLLGKSLKIFGILKHSRFSRVQIIRDPNQTSFRSRRKLISIVLAIYIYSIYLKKQFNIFLGQPISEWFVANTLELWPSNLKFCKAFTCLSKWACNSTQLKKYIASIAALFWAFILLVDLHSSSLGFSPVIKCCPGAKCVFGWLS